MNLQTHLLDEIRDARASSDSREANASRVTADRVALEVCAALLAALFD